MDNKEKVERIISNVKELNRIIHNNHHEIAKKNNLTLDQFHLLIFISKSDNIQSVGKLAARFNNAQNTMSEKISRLEERDLLKRVKDNRDRRKSRVIITDKGISLIDSIHYEASNEYIYSSIENMERTVVDELLFGLEDFVKNLKEN